MADSSRSDAPPPTVRLTWGGKTGERFSRHRLCERLKYEQRQAYRAQQAQAAPTPQQLLQELLRKGSR